MQVGRKYHTRIADDQKIKEVRYKKVSYCIVKLFKIKRLTFL